MNLLGSRRRLSRILVALLILAAQAMLAPLAHASPPDPAWIPGIYDAADYDDVVLLVSSDAGGIAPGALSTIQPLPRMVETLGPSHESAPPTLHASAVGSRAPPAP